jgi:hypothetical protein
MNMGKFLCAVAGLALVLAVSPAIYGQAGSGRGFGPGGRFSEFHGTVTTGAPYSATRTITRVQKLDNGTTITHTEVVKEARDSDGRTFNERQPETTGAGAGNRTFVRVFDPVNRVAISWSSNSKQATVVHLPDASPAGMSRLAQGSGGAGGPVHFRGGMQAENVENLGTKTINGVTAEGTRTTRVIPAGTQGNDQPLTVTHESWVSSDLKIAVMRVDADPRFGTTTVELTNISRDQPPAALFQAPAGYTVNERTPSAPNRAFDAEP